GGTLADAAEALSRDLDSSEVESVPLEPGRTDVIRLMNLHKAKGLEAPVIFLADPLRGGADSVDVRTPRDGLRAPGYLEIYRERAWERIVLGQPAAWAQHQENERGYLAAEATHLVYADATGAER